MFFSISFTQIPQNSTLSPAQFSLCKISLKHLFFFIKKNNIFRIDLDSLKHFWSESDHLVMTNLISLLETTSYLHYLVSYFVSLFSIFIAALFLIYAFSFEYIFSSKSSHQFIYYKYCGLSKIIGFVFIVNLCIVLDELIEFRFVLFFLNFLVLVLQLFLDHIILTPITMIISNKQTSGDITDRRRKDNIFWKFIYTVFAILNFKYTLSKKL